MDYANDTIVYVPVYGRHFPQVTGAAGRTERLGECSTGSRWRALGPNRKPVMGQRPIGGSPWAGAAESSAHFSREWPRPESRGHRLPMRTSALRSPRQRTNPQGSTTCVGDTHSDLEVCRNITGTAAGPFSVTDLGPGREKGERYEYLMPREDAGGVARNRRWIYRGRSANDGPRLIEIRMLKTNARRRRASGALAPDCAASRAQNEKE